MLTSNHAAVQPSWREQIIILVRASGDQLREIGSLIDSGAIRPVVDQVFPFASTNEAMPTSTGRAKGKVVVRVR